MSAVLVCVSCSSGGPNSQTREASLVPTTSGESVGSLNDTTPTQNPGTQTPAKEKATPPPKPKRRPTYPLDTVSRKVAISGKVACPPVELVDYPGQHIPYQKNARVYVGFADHLRRFEKITEQVAIEVYGRAPSKIITYGSYYCRRIRSWPYLISEHGLGNALDVAGFEFKKISGENSRELPASLRRAFKVSMSKHWNASAKDKVHEKFLHLLATRVIASEGLFRVILGPADPKHHDHFHFDMAPFRIVNVF